MVLIGAGRSFIAGADIRQFGKPRPILNPTSLDVIDGSTKPVVAAIHGFALGGGLEHALACHYRVAVASAKVGLPEVLIGVLPGGGGTQRLPRLIGPKAAMDMIVTGRHVPAEEAKTLGIIDAIVPGKDLRREAIEFAQGIAMSFADFGVPVKILEATQEALDRGMQRIRDNYAISVKRGSLAQAEMDKRLPLITPVTD